MCTTCQSFYPFLNIAFSNPHTCRSSYELWEILDGDCDIRDVVGIKAMYSHLDKMLLSMFVQIGCDRTQSKFVPQPEDLCSFFLIYHYDIFITRNMWMMSYNETRTDFWKGCHIMLNQGIDTLYSWTIKPNMILICLHFYHFSTASKAKFEKETQVKPLRRDFALKLSKFLVSINSVYTTHILFSF